jgi:hypothetical protein
MFTFNEIRKHVVLSDDSSGTESDSDSSVEENDTKQMSVYLHVVDTTFQPKRSLRNGTETIPAFAKNVHKFRQYIGEGTQNFRWLVLAARERLLNMYKNHGKVRHRERVVGIAGAFLPNLVKSEDPETDGDFLLPETTLNEVLRDGDTVWIEFNQDGGKVTKWEAQAFYTTHGTDYVEAAVQYEEVVIDDEDFIEEQKVSPVNARAPVAAAKKADGECFFLMRCREAESRDFYETKDLVRRAFRADWKRVKKPKFVAENQAEAKRILFENFPFFHSVFTYYSATGSGSAFDMGVNDMHELMRTCNLKTETNISVIWASTNFNKRASKRNGLDQDMFDGDTRALSRYEFLELLLRLADLLIKDEARSYGKLLAKYRMKQSAKREDKPAEKEATREGDAPEAEAEAVVETMPLAEPVRPTTSFSERLEQVCTAICDNAFLSVNAAEIFFADPDMYRRDRLYFPEVDKILLKYQDRLFTLYRVYAAKSSFRVRAGGSDADALLYLQEYMEMVQDSKIITKMKRDDASLEDAQLAFVFSQMQLIDPLLTRSKKAATEDAPDRSTFLEFVEALARASDMFTMDLKDGEDVPDLPPLSSTLDNFMKTFLDGFGPAFWGRHPIKSYKKALSDKYGPYQKLYRKYGPGPQHGRVETPMSMEDLNRRIQTRKSGVVPYPDSLLDRFDVRDEKLLVKFRAQEKARRDAELKQQMLDRRK